MTDKAPQTNETQQPPTVSLTIDGQNVVVPKGTNVLEAAKTTGADISAFCYHPGLSIAACCRQCLVSVEKSGKLLPSCQTEARDGMVVETKDKRSTIARQQMLEFTLLNHPIDCPICDKAGECTLQKLYFDHDNKPSRVDVVKVRKPKVVDLGPHIVLDAERCILCTRCIRVCDEVAGQHQLEMKNRGDHEEITCAPGEQLDNPYSLNTVDVCPVGALTSKDFRFTMRAWELMMTPSVCNGCDTGCNIEIHHKNDRIWRLIPRENLQVNQHWMCDEGRFTYKEIRDNRRIAPTVGGLPSTVDKALNRAAEILTQAKEQGQVVAFIASAGLSNEDNFALLQLMKKWNPDSPMYLAVRPDEPDREDEILRSKNINPNHVGAKAVLGDAAKIVGVDGDNSVDNVEAKVVLALGNELLDTAIGDATLLSIATHNSSSYPTVGLPCSAWAEVDATVTGRHGITQRLHESVSAPGAAMPAWQWIVALSEKLGCPLSFSEPKQVFGALQADNVGFKDCEWGYKRLPVSLRFAGSRG